MAARRQHAGPDHLGHPHARNARRRISGIPEAQRIVQADSGRDAFERGQHLGTHPPAGRGCGRLYRQTVQSAGAQNTH